MKDTIKKLMHILSRRQKMVMGVMAVLILIGGILETLGVSAILPVINGILDVFVASMRGMGYSTLPTMVMVGGICGVRLAWLWTVFPMFRELSVIYMCFPISWTITSIIQAFFWKFCLNKTMKTAESASL